MAANETTRQDDSYYFDVVTFEVEGVLFRVPKQGFDVPGTPFETMFTLPSGEGQTPEGQSDSNPIHLRGVSNDAFKSFLKVLYPLRNTVLTFTDWVNVLNLSAMWCFDQIKEDAVRALTNPFADGDLDSKKTFAQITLGKRHSIQPWLRAGYTRLIRRREHLAISEIANSGLDAATIARIYTARELVWVQCYRAACNGNDPTSTQYLKSFDTITEEDNILHLTFPDEIPSTFNCRTSDGDSLPLFEI